MTKIKKFITKTNDMISIKKIAPLFSLMLLTGVLSAQSWKKNCGASPRFSDIQKSFKDYYANKQAPRNEFLNKEDGEYMHYKRWENFIKNRLDASGRFPSNQLFNEFQKQKLFKKTNSTTTANWQYIGATSVPLDGGGAGRLNALEFDPTNSQTMWVGAANGGLWKSTNGGTSWTSNTDFLSNLSVADIAINPQNTNEMYVATGDNSGYELGVSFWGGTYSSGILKSVNGGSTWSATGLSYAMIDANVIHKILLFPNTPQTLLAAHRNGIERSTDGGATWTNVSIFVTFDFEIDPSNPNVVYAVGDGKCLKSIDQGLTWTSATVSTNIGRMSISISPANSSKIYVLNEIGELFLSTNAGTSFTLVKNVPNASGIALYGYYDCVLAVSPTNANEIYVAGLDVAKSLDGGNSWVTVGDWVNYQNPDYLHADNHYIEFLPNNGTTLFSCNDGGIFKSTNNGATWTDLSANLQIAQYYRIGSSLSNPTMYYLGQQDNGSIQANNNVFTTLLSGDGMESVVDKTNPDKAIISYQNGNFFQTTDNWVNYTDITVGSGVGAWTTPIQLDEQNQNIIYAGYDEVYKSLDFGLTWNPISAFNNFNEIEYLAVAPSNSNYIYLANDNAFLYTHNGGATWASALAGLPNAGAAGIVFIAVSNTNPNNVWITYNGYDTGDKVFASVDGGINWTNYSGTLPNIPCNTIVYQPNSATNELYVGTDFGVYYRNNTMTDWATFQTNLPNVIVNELEIIPSLNAIRAATYGRGVWQSPLNNPIDVGIDELKSASATQVFVYPNPTKNKLNLHFKNMMADEIMITDVLGKIVFKENNLKQQNELSIERLEAGVYLYQIMKNNKAIAQGKIIKE